tara:strand:- start:707 stop:1120 length:414 start_codon:yes stop_codon:yes gene_type:complete
MRKITKRNAQRLLESRDYMQKIVWAIDQMSEVHDLPVKEGDEVYLSSDSASQPTRYLCVFRVTPTEEVLRLENWDQVGLPESMVTDTEDLWWESRDWSKTSDEGGNDCPMCAKEPSNNGEICGECEAYCNSICEEGV